MNQDPTSKKHHTANKKHIMNKVTLGIVRFLININTPNIKASIAAGI
jgi:hypothetical protein